MKRSISLFFFFVLLLSACVKPYEPPAIRAKNNYLVIDGVINTNANGITTIVLSRSKNLVDTVSFIPELNAKIAIVSASGLVYNLFDSSQQGKYISAPLNLNATDQYKIQIVTSNNHRYESSFVSAKATPAIDSISWNQDELNKGINLKVSTHDPNNQTKYYRWDFVETWQYNTKEIAQWVNIDGYIRSLSIDFLNDPLQTHQCWSTKLSPKIIVGNSIGLTKDVISMQPLHFIPYNDERLTIKYSILVSQYALSQDAYNYWQLVQNNSQSLGSLFDLMPSQLVSNISCISDPNEPVIGYISASSIQQKRIFIRNNEVNNWLKRIPGYECLTQIIETDPVDFRRYSFADTTYAPWYFSGSNPPFLVVVKKSCVDCRIKGGVNTKPSFW
jgi:hypothetical protein